MTKPFSFRLDDALRKKLEAEAERTKKSVAELIHEAVDHWFKCDKIEGIPEMRLILLKYHARCLKCGCDLPPNTWAMYGKGVGAICTDCFIEKLGDKGIVKKFMKVKELKWTMKSLENQLNEKAEKLRQFNFYEVIDQMHKGYGEIHKLIMAYLKTGFQKPEKEKEALDELERLIKKQWAIIQEAQMFIKGPPLKKKKKKDTYVS